MSALFAQRVLNRRHVEQDAILFLKSGGEFNHGRRGSEAAAYTGYYGAGRSEKCERFFATSGRELSEKTLSVHVPDVAKKAFLTNAESKKVCSRDCSICGGACPIFLATVKSQARSFMPHRETGLKSAPQKYGNQSMVSICLDASQSN